MNCSMPGLPAITNSQSSLKHTSIELVMPSTHLILCHPLLLLSPIPPSIRVFSNESTLRMKWPKYWSFSFSIIPSKERSYLTSEVRGGIPECRAATVQEWPRGATLRPRSGVAAGRSYSMSKKRWLCRHRRAERSHSTFKVRRGSGEEIPLVQGKEQWLPFAGAAMKRYPMSKVRETQVRW